MTKREKRLWMPLQNRLEDQRVKEQNPTYK